MEKKHKSPCSKVNFHENTCRQSAPGSRFKTLPGPQRHLLFLLLLICSPNKSVPKSNFLKKFIFGEKAYAGKGQREGETESQAGSVPSAQSPHVGLELTLCEIMTWAKIKSGSLNRLCHPGTPQIWFLTLDSFCLFFELYKNGIIQCPLFGDWLLSLNVPSVTFIHIVACGCSLFSFFALSLSMNAPALSILLMMDIWAISGFWLLLVGLLWIFLHKSFGEHMCISLLCMLVGVELFGQSICMISLSRCG